MNANTLLDRLLREANASKRSERSYIVRFRDAAAYRKIAGILKKAKHDHAARWKQLLPLPFIQAIALPLRSSRSLAALGIPGVQVEGNARIRVHTTMSRKNESNIIVPWGVRHLRIPQVWPITDGSGIRIGVIDTGVDYQHPDLRPVLSRGINVLNPRTLPLDDNGHGTHIAGTIAAAGGTEGMNGVAPAATIHPVKAFDHNGSAYVSDIIYAIDWCVRNGMNIINMSFGMKKKSDALLAAVQNAERAGVIVVTSSGNDGKRAELDYPARFPEVIAVGAVDKHNRIASFSNYGKRVDVYAPGDHIYSTWLRGKYHAMSGTSMATAHVSGMIALLLSVKPSLRPMQVRALLKRCASPPGPGKKRSPARLDAVRLFKLAGVRPRGATSVLAR